MKQENKERLALVAALGLIAFALVSRLLPHPPNFTPLAAVAIFGALYLPKRFALVIPLGAMLLSDAVIGFYTLPIMVAVYGSFALTGVFALYVRRQKNILAIFSATLAGSLLFFFITNGAVWAFGTMYPHSLHGLYACYASAVPFFRNTLVGDLFYTGIFVGIAEMALAMSKTQALFSPKNT